MGVRMLDEFQYVYKLLVKKNIFKKYLKIKLCDNLYKIYNCVKIRPS